MQYMTEKYPNHLNDCKCLKSSCFTEDDKISLDRPQAAECLTVASPVRVQYSRKPQLAREDGAQRVHVMYSLLCLSLWLAHDTNCQVEVKNELNQAHLNLIDIYCSLN